MLWVPSLFGSNVLKVTSELSSPTGVVGAPLAITFCTVPPLKSSSSPHSYFSFVGFTNFIPTT